MNISEWKVNKTMIDTLNRRLSEVEDSFSNLDDKFRLIENEVDRIDKQMQEMAFDIDRLKQKLEGISLRVTMVTDGF